MTKLARAPRHAIYQEGSTWRRFSPWARTTRFDECCTCGSTHENQYSVEIERGEYVVYIRTRKSVARTKIARKFFARILKQLFRKIDNKWG
jgi:hypothetical protein